MGFIATYINDLDTKIAYITLFAVHKEYRNKKIGSTLIDYVIKVAKEKQMSELKLEVKKSNNVAMNFYINKGFIQCGQASFDSVYLKYTI